MPLNEWGACVEARQIRCGADQQSPPNEAYLQDPVRYSLAALDTWKADMSLRVYLASDVAACDCV